MQRCFTGKLTYTITTQLRQGVDAFGQILGQTKNEICIEQTLQIKITSLYIQLAELLKCEHSVTLGTRLELSSLLIWA